MGVFRLTGAKMGESGSLEIVESLAFSFGPSRRA